MSSSPPNERFVQKLQEQLRFMQRSCEAFDSGAEEEALRIGTALRVIFHNLKRSVSLTTHLGLNDAKMLSSSRGHGDYHDYLSFRFDLSSSQPMRAVPILGTKFREIPLSTWWQTEPVFVHAGTRYTRSALVRSAVDKDGGAHVDATLEQFYEALSEGNNGVGFGITGNLTFEGNTPPFQQGVTHYAKNAHLALIRQFAHETLLSASRFPRP